MGGGQLSCGTFVGCDKSASPIQAVLLTAFERAFGRPPRSGLPLIAARFFSKSDPHLMIERFVADFGGAPQSEISPDLAAALLPIVSAYHDFLRQRLGAPDPAEAPEIDRERGVDMTKAKWGLVLGEGWHYHCSHDLLLALQRCIETGSPVEIEMSP